MARPGHQSKKVKPFLELQLGRGDLQGAVEKEKVKELGATLPNKASVGQGLVKVRASLHCVCE